MKPWVGIVAVYGSIPMVLLFCGGDFTWWQGWGYALIVISTGLGGRIWAEHRNPGLLAERQDREKIKEAEDWDKVLAPLMALGFSFPLVVVAGLDHRFAWSPVFAPWLALCGLFLVLVGYLFATWALAENRFFASVVRIQTERGHAVCDSGPYRLVRHPGYAGNLLALPGVVLALGSLWTIVPAIAALIIAIVRTSMEDAFLQKELPGYAEYSQTVRYRLIPGVY